MDVMLCALSLRAASYNRKLVNLAGETVKAQGHSHKPIDLNNFIMPYYNQEIQDHAFPPEVLALKNAIDKSQALILSSPEYNFSMPGHFKNTLDWLSRCKEQPFKNKPILLLSASPGMFAGNRGLWALRIPLESLGAFVFPNMFSLPLAHENFTADGKLKDPEHLSKLNKMVESFLEFSNSLAY